MGFDNECIVNIQSLAGEYFCPVCRLLVYPNEALQSQCTHLYCKPCLTYVVSTTRACPYDGYLVTEADSKPLMESNKTLAETIGKIPVHCLYHRSGCTWQGTLSECTSHCSGCAFGNSPVVCNRCGIQIVHRQVQEHAQSCPGVQQVAGTQDPSTTGAIPSTDQKQTAAPVGAMASQALNSQTAVTTAVTTAMPGQVSNQLPHPASQSQPVQTAAQPTAEQWYQQQQYQQYYQQYPGQDPYQQQYQHYYPYQQSVVPQYQQAYGQPQPQSQSQPQAQLQSQGQPQAQHQAQPQLQPQPQASGLSQTLPQVQASAAPPSQTQIAHQQQQQLQPAVQQHSQIQPPSHPPGHTQVLPQPQPQPQPYPYPQVPHAVQPQSQQHMQMPPYQQPPPQMQHSQPQIQQPVQKYPIPQPQAHPQPQPNAPVQHLSQPQLHPYQPLAPNAQPQAQNASSHAVTGYHSYPQPQPHQSMQPGAPQHTMQMHAQSGPLPQAQHPVPMQNQFPQQIPMMHPHQSPATFPNQQQPALLPSPVRGQSTPPLQQQPVYNPNQQPGQINHRPNLQPVQQILPQQPFAQHQMPMPSHLRPQGPAHTFPRHALPPSQGNPVLLSSTQHSQSQNAGGRPFIPNQAAQIQPFPQSANNIPVRPGQTGAGHPPENQNLLIGTNNQVQLSSDLQSRVPEQIGRRGDSAEQQTDPASGKLGKNFKDFETVSGSANELKSEKVETDTKPVEVGNKQNGADPNSVKTSGLNANALEDSVSKSVRKGAENTREAGNQSVNTIIGVQNNSNEHSALRGNEIQDGPLLKTEAKKVSESETDKLHNDDMRTTRPPGADSAAPAAASQTHGSQRAGLDEYRGMQSGGFAQPLSSGHSSTLVRNHGPGHGPHSGQPLNSAESFQPTMFQQPQGSDVQYGNPGQSFPPQSRGPYNQGQEPPFHATASNLSRIGGPQFGAPPPGDMHGGMATNLPPHGPEGFGLRHERFNSFQVPGHQNFDRRELEDDYKKFPRPPLDAEPISKFGNYPLGPHEAGKRPVGFHDNAIKKSSATLHPGYHLGLGPGYGRHHVDGMAPRSPGSEYAEMPPLRFGPLSGGLVSNADIDDFDGRGARRFGDSAGIAFHDRRFPHPPGHLHRDEFEGFGNFRMGEHPRSGDFIGQDEFSGHFQRGEDFGPHNFPRRLPPGEPIVFGAHPGHMRAVELSGSRSFESFSKGNRPGHPQLGEPGFRSSFSLPGFPNDAGFLPGDIRSFDNLRRRKSMGWCRICRVDCETVEGLDLHSQTREHQKMAMDMVKSIKQNVKKQKLTPGEHPSVEDGNKSRNTGLEGRGNKH